jgi:Domain of unknown function (DUF222)
MPEVSSPGDGQDGEQPPPGVPARDEADDWNPDREMAAFIADLDAGRARIPEEWELEGPAATISLGDAADVDLAELASMLGPEGLAGEVFAQDRPADAMRPGPVLAALTESAAADPAALTDNQLLGTLAAARRLAARAEYLELAVIAEFTRRRHAQYQAAVARKVPPGRRDGEFADAELAMELITSARDAGNTMDFAEDLYTRLPRTRNALAAGLIGAGRARIIWRYTRHLGDSDAATADEVLAAAAPLLRHDQLARKAIAVAMKLDPEAMARAKEQARKEGQRVQARREESGNASLSGRELAIEDVLASKAYIDGLAAALRSGGLTGSLRQLRVLAFTDLTQGRNPLDRLTRPQDGQAGNGGRDGGHRDRPQADGERPGGTGADDHESSDRADSPGTGDEPRGGTGGDEHRDGGHPQGQDDRDDDAGEGEDEAGDSHRHDALDEDPWDEDEHDRHDGPDGTSGAVAPFPALINLVVPASTLFGWSGAPGDAGGWDLTDAEDTRRLVHAASQDPRTRWCHTLTGPDGTAIAHGCARGPHPWNPEPAGSSRDGPGPPDTTATRNTAADGPNARQAAALADFLRRLNITLTPIAKGTCDHASEEHRYTPSRKLKHIVRARTTRCTAPGCGAQAACCDLDHTTAYPAGRTCQCNLSPPCRRHHRAKQAPGWQLTQPEPGVMRWTTPSGRSYTTGPTSYET